MPAIEARGHTGEMRVHRLIAAVLCNGSSSTRSLACSLAEMR